MSDAALVTEMGGGIEESGNDEGVGEGSNGKVEGSLTAHGGKEGIGPLIIEDLPEELQCHGADVGIMVAQLDGALEGVLVYGIVDGIELGTN